MPAHQSTNRAIRQSTDPLPHPRLCMKLSLFTALAALALLAGCNSLDNPLAGFDPLRTGRDARTYNVQTGEYEWPRDSTPRPRPRTARTAAAATPAPAGDGRYYDPMKREFTEPDARR
jgi:hypothetical protein